MGNKNSTEDLDEKLRAVRRKYGIGYSYNESSGYYEKESARINTWRIPKEPKWTVDDGLEIRQFYNDHVKIKGRDWQKNCEYIDHLLEYIFSELKLQAEKTYPFLQLQRFVRQGSAREGLKVTSADEFDAVFPVRFVLFDTWVIESPDNGLPPGLAEIEITRIRGNITPSSLIKHRDGKDYVNTRVFHDTIFKGLIDKIIYNFKNECDNLRERGIPVSFQITRKSHAPALILDVTVNEKDDSGYHIGTAKMSVDIVPGFLIDADNSMKFLVSRWIPESQNIHFRTLYPDCLTTWRVSFSHFEMKVFEDFQNKNDTVALRLIAACRILKAIKASSRRGFPSQFTSVLTSYHLKNILLYSLLYVMVARKTIGSVTEALGYLVAMIRKALSEGNLPQCLGDKYAFAKFYPREPQHNDEELNNLLSEKSETSLQQAKLDMDRVLEEHELGHVLFGDHAELLTFFADRLNGVVPEEGWQCVIQ